MQEPICMSPVGIIRTPFQSPEGMPIQNCGAKETKGRIEIFPPYQAALSDLDGFERLILIYVFHRSCGWSPVVTPYLDTNPRGLFATRAPRRPNSLGLSIVRLLKVEDGEILISDIDVLDGTPLLDIKPYIPGFDSFPESRAGWLEEAQYRAGITKSDTRFLQGENY